MAHLNNNLTSVDAVLSGVLSSETIGFGYRLQRSRPMRRSGRDLVDHAAQIPRPKKKPTRRFYQWFRHHPGYTSTPRQQALNKVQHVGPGQHHS